MRCESKQADAAETAVELASTDDEPPEGEARKQAQQSAGGGTQEGISTEPDGEAVRKEKRARAEADERPTQGNERDLVDSFHRQAVSMKISQHEECSTETKASW